MKRRKRARRSDNDPAIAVILQATRVFERKLPGFKCDAIQYVTVNDHAHTVTHANAYKGRLSSKYRPEVYTFPLDEAKLAGKVVGMCEVEVTDWPEFIIAAVKPSGRGRGVRS